MTFQKFFSKEMVFSPGKSSSSGKKLKTNENFKCSVCKEAFALRFFLQQHQKKGHVQCQQCPKQFGKRQKLIDHVLKAHSEKQYKCILCSCDYRKRNNLVRHFRQHHKDVRTPVRSASVTGQDKYCIYCKAPFERAQLFYNHMMLVHQDVEHKICEICQEHVWGDFSDHFVAHPQLPSIQH